MLRTHEISSATDYAWKWEYGRLNASELKRLRELEAENTKLKACTRTWFSKIRAARSHWPKL